jgi:hypothetical protein
MKRITDFMKKGVGGVVKSGESVDKSERPEPHHKIKLPYDITDVLSKYDHRFGHMGGMRFRFKVKEIPFRSIRKKYMERRLVYPPEFGPFWICESTKVGDNWNLRI